MVSSEAAYDRRDEKVFRAMKAVVLGDEQHNYLSEHQFKHYATNEAVYTTFTEHQKQELDGVRYRK